MSKLSLPLTRLIHENLSTVMTFSFSIHALETLRATKFKGEWKYLDESLFIISEQRAVKACIELATFLCLLDDQQNLSDYLRKRKGFSFGRVIKADTPAEDLYLRDLTNKIIHASGLEWDFSDTGTPKLVCISGDPKRWIRAEINIVSLATLCGGLMG